MWSFSSDCQMLQVLSAVNDLYKVFIRELINSILNGQMYLKLSEIINSHVMLNA